MSVDYNAVISNRRVGRIIISRALFSDNPNLVQNILSKVFVMETRSSFLDDSQEYIVYSESFDSLEIGAMIPEYDVEIFEDGHFTFKRFQ